MAVGGYHRFYQCTFANYFDYANRIDPTILISNNVTVNDVEYIGDMDAYFGNSIIYGSNIEEIGTSKNDQAALNFMFENCLIKDSTYQNEEFILDLTDESHFINIINNRNPKFKDLFEYNYELDTLSVAKDAGSMDVIKDGNLIIEQLFSVPDILNTDLLGNSRINDSNPDLGAYERIEE